MCQDAEAETQYNQRLNASLPSSAAADSSCALALRRVSCLRVFSVCGLGSPELLCRDSCSLVRCTTRLRESDAQ